MNVLADRQARGRLRDPPEVGNPVRQIDVSRSGLTSIIWATGYSLDYSWIDLPVLDACGRPKHEHGVAPVAGIYFLGLPWLSKMSSSFLSGVHDAARLAEAMDPTGGIRRPRLAELKRSGFFG